MRNPLLPAVMLLLLAVALYLLPDGALYSWRLWLRGAFARLEKPADPRQDASLVVQSFPRDLMDILSQKDAEIAELGRRLRDLGITRERVPNVNIIPAQIIRLGQDNTLDTFTIDVGSRDGVAPGQAVVVGEALAGVVVKSEANASLVLSLASPGCYISARLGEPHAAAGRPRVLGAVQGAGGGRVKIVLFSAENVATEGWLAMTSGLEKTIPEDLLLGTVAGRFSEGSESGTMEAELRPAVDLTSLDFVAVVVKK